ncbi:MAG: gliding motility-associated C-terminal domain-containing protein [Bacteroidetes bacterium]|nr:gliding motility-associated C-terminal domain-containing protein [Bacteroidota bacterium]
MRFKTIATTLVFLISILNLHSQGKQGNMWHFGFNAGVNFNTIPPTPITSSISTSEGSASVANSVGQTLFYTDGLQIWDKNNSLMPNADGSSWNKQLSGDGSSAQSALITNNPCDTNKYYVFTTDGITCNFLGPQGQWDGLYYTVVNTSLNAGSGDIDLSYLSTQPGYVAGDNKIALIDSVQERITAATHANGTDYWVVVLRENGEFYSYLVDCNGINTTPVITKTFASPFTATQGFISISKDGTCLVVTGINSGEANMYDFDNTTGVVSNKRLLYSGSDWTWGVCFSPNDSIIYIASWFSSTIRRYDRFASNVAASEIQDNTGMFGITVIQQGPDGKLYIPDGSNLSVYNTPNNFSNPGLASAVISALSGTYYNYGLPNVFLKYYSTSENNLVQSDTNICPGGSVQLSRATPSNCYTYNWQPTTGLSNPNILNPIATLEETTTYKLIATSSCATIEKEITIEVCFTEIKIPNVFTPNGDGIDDNWTITSAPGNTVNCIIYNRWGEIIFEANEENINWTGTSKNGKTASDGTYYYVLTHSKPNNNEVVEYKGFVTLLR